VAVEVGAVVAIIALLLAMGFSLYRGARLAARVSAAKSKLKQVSTALELFFRRFNSYPPQGSDLTVELAPFVDNPGVFKNPLLDEETPGESINALYRQPSLEDLDRPNTYLTAMISDNGRTAVILRSGSRVDARGDLDFDPNAPPSDLLALLDPEEAGEDDPEPTGHRIDGRINLNPNNCDDFEFRLELPDRSVITRDDLHASDGSLTYDGPAVLVRVKPKGNGNQNSLTVDGDPYPVRNGTLYTITSTDMTVNLYNERPGRGHGKAMGKWWIEIAAEDATIN